MYFKLGKTIAAGKHCYIFKKLSFKFDGEIMTVQINTNIMKTNPPIQEIFKKN